MSDADARRRVPRWLVRVLGFGGFWIAVITLAARTRLAFVPWLHGALWVLAVLGAVAAVVLLGWFVRLVRMLSADGLPPVAQWYHVRVTEDAIVLQVAPPLRAAWDATIAWDTIERVCFAAEGPGESDGIYLFVRGRTNSYAVPADADGGGALWDELVRRGCFDAALAVRAMSASSGIFCWPPPAA